MRVLYTYRDRDRDRDTCSEARWFDWTMVMSGVVFMGCLDPVLNVMSKATIQVSQYVYMYMAVFRANMCVSHTSVNAEDI